MGPSLVRMDVWSDCCILIVPTEKRNIKEDHYLQYYHKIIIIIIIIIMLVTHLTGNILSALAKIRVAGDIFCLAACFQFEFHCCYHRRWQKVRVMQNHQM